MPKMPWNASKKTGSTTSVTQDDIDTLRSKVAEQSARITELEARLNVVDVIDKNLENLSTSELKTLCLELDSSNKKLKEEMVNITHEKDQHIQQLQHKMNFVVSEKDKQLKRVEALGSSESKALANQQDKKQIRMAISAETAKTVDPRKLPKVPKSERDRAFIEKALQQNTFFKNLKGDQITKIIDCMEKKKLKADVEIIREGTDGTYLYILEEGEVSISNNEMGHIADIKEGKVFGELAILYNCKRTASVRSKTDVIVYQLDRKYHKTIVQSTGAAKDEARLALLKAVPKMKDLGDSKLKKICDCMEDEIFVDGDCIIKQGTVGDLFYIIKEGKVKCTKNRDNGEEEPVAELTKGNYFGELALRGLGVENRQK